VVEILLREKLTGFPIVPTIASVLLQMNLKAATFRACATSPTPPQCCPLRKIRQLREAFPEGKLYSMYGLTECKRVSYSAAGPA